MPEKDKKLRNLGMLENAKLAGNGLKSKIWLILENMRPIIPYFGSMHLISIRWYSIV
ncbi:MAG: hypothetical protein ABIH83_00425 [Candidatus Micrarchaeota archaeon]